MSMDNYQNYLKDKKEASKGDGNKIFFLYSKDEYPYFYECFLLLNAF